MGPEAAIFSPAPPPANQGGGHRQKDEGKLAETTKKGVSQRRGTQNGRFLGRRRTIVVSQRSVRTCKNNPRTALRTGGGDDGETFT